MKRLDYGRIQEAADHGYKSVFVDPATLRIDPYSFKVSLHRHTIDISREMLDLLLGGPASEAMGVGIYYATARDRDDVRAAARAMRDALRPGRHEFREIYARGLIHTALAWRPEEGAMHA